MNKRQAEVFAATVFLFNIAAFTSGVCPRDHYNSSDTGSCKPCSVCLRGTRIIRKCTETSDIVCSNECRNPQHFFTPHYTCRAVKEKDCLDSNHHVSGSPTDCKTEGEHCRCQVTPLNWQKVECVCITEPPDPTTTTIRTMYASTRARTSPATPTSSAANVGKETVDESSLLVGLSVTNVAALVVILCVVVWLWCQRHVTPFSCHDASQRNVGDTTTASKENLVSNSQLEAQNRRSSFKRLFSCVGAGQKMIHSNPLGEHYQGGSADSPTNTPNSEREVAFPLPEGEARPAVTSRGNKSVMARDVFTQYHHKDRLISLLGHVIGNTPSWKFVASYLGYSNEETLTFEGNSVGQQRAAELFYDTWVIRSDATIGCLLEAARKANRNDIEQHIHGVWKTFGYGPLELGIQETML